MPSPQVPQLLQRGTTEQGQQILPTEGTWQGQPLCQQSLLSEVSGAQETKSLTALPKKSLNLGSFGFALKPLALCVVYL